MRIKGLPPTFRMQTLGWWARPVAILEKGRAELGHRFTINRYRSRRRRRLAGLVARHKPRRHIVVGLPTPLTRDHHAQVGSLADVACGAAGEFTNDAGEKVEYGQKLAFTFDDVAGVSHTFALSIKHLDGVCNFDVKTLKKFDAVDLSLGVSQGVGDGGPYVRVSPKAARLVKSAAKAAA